MASMRSPSKNMCSVRVRPMPVAPKAMALRGLLRGCRRWCGRRGGWPCAHHFMSWWKLLNFSVFCAALSPCDDAGDDLATERS